MKISAIYYLDYPDCDPLNSEDADSEVRFELKEDSSIYTFDSCYSVRVMTIKRLARMLASDGTEYVTLGPVIIVKSFDDATIRDAIASIIPNVDRYAQQIE